MAESESTRVLLVDDRELFRHGVKMVLTIEAGLALSEAADGQQALELVAAEAPDVVLLDVRMPGMSGMEVCAAIKELSPTTGIIMLTESEEEADLYESIRSGASGYLLKSTSSFEQIAEAVRLVADGQSLINPRMATKLLDEFVSISRDGPPGLTRRELDVLRSIARGSSNRQIAEELVIAENTVKNHIRNILEKLQLKSRVEAAMYAVRSNLVDE